MYFFTEQPNPKLIISLKHIKNRELSLISQLRIKSLLNLHQTLLFFAENQSGYQNHHHCKNCHHNNINVEWEYRLM